MTEAFPSPAPIDKAKPNHPPGMVTLFFTEMWERFSYYGMRALLTLFMVDQVQKGGLGLDDKTAAAIYGLYTALVYVAALPGGWIGDHILGLRRSVWWGGVVIAVGHLILGIHRVETFYLGLLVVALGSGLLKSNMSALVGQLYPEGGARRDAGFTVFYMGINIGAFLGQMACPFLAAYLGWRWGFSAAAVGMICGLVVFKFTEHRLGSAGLFATPPPALRRNWGILIGAMALTAIFTVLCMKGIIRLDPVSLSQRTTQVIAALAVLYFAWAFLLAGLDRQEKKHLGVIAVLFSASALFWMGFEQVGSSFTLFAERYTLRHIGTFEIPAGSFHAINPVLVITLAPVIASMWLGMARRGREPRMATKLAWALLLLASGFLVATWGSQRALATGQPVWPTWLLSVYFIRTVGELFLSPVGLSAVTKLSPQRLQGQMMGVWFLGAALGNILAGLVAGEASGSAMPAQFMEVVYISGAAGLLLWLCSRAIQKLMPGVK
jgi:POT family proton-dependent oligopeptide transporter